MRSLENNIMRVIRMDDEKCGTLGFPKHQKRRKGFSEKVGNGRAK